MYQENLITIGELSWRSGVAVSALRYYEQLGLLQPHGRVFGKRHYTEDAVAAVGLIRFLRDAHFTLSEIVQLTTAGPEERHLWRTLAKQKLTELDELIASASAAREALDHARRCPHRDVRDCPTFRKIVARHQAGEPLAAAHAHGHTTPHSHSDA